MSGNVVDDSLGALRLATSGFFLVSYLLKSAVLLGLEVPPCIVSFATSVEADDFGTRGQDPYQLRVLWTWCNAGTSVVGVKDAASPPCCDSFRSDALAPSPPSCCETGCEVAGVADTVAEAGVGVEASLACDVDVDCDGIVGGTLAEGLPLAAAGFGFARLRGAMIEKEFTWATPELSRLWWL